jgi:ankyrin repeat protein
LEDNLQQLSYTLQPFFEDEQVEFLKKFWPEKLNLGATKQHSLQIYDKALITKLAQSISDKDKEFTGIPLQIRMLAEVFDEEFKSFYLSEKSEPELPHKLVLGLYGRFIESKYDIYYKEKCKSQSGNVGVEEQRESYLKCMQERNQRLALQALFTGDQVTFWQNDDESTFSDEELARIGIVQRNNDGKPQFIHRTFAEYFVAEFLIKQLTKKSKQHEKVQEFLLNVVLIKEDCQVIRAFLDGLLKKSEKTKEPLREYEEKLDGECYNKQVHAPLEVAKTALHKAANEGNVHIVGFLIQKLCDWAKELQLKPEKLRSKVLLSKNDFGNTAWHLAAEGGQVAILKKLWKWAKELHLKPEELRYELLLSKIKNGYTAWHMAAEGGQVAILEKLWNWANELQIKPEEIRNDVLLSKSENGYTVWHMAAKNGQVKILEKLCNWVKELQLKPEEIRNEVLLSKSKNGYTAWHLAAEGGQVAILEKLWNLAKEPQLKPEEIINGVLLSKNKNGDTAWHLAAERSQIEILEKLWNWAKELQLKRGEIRNKVLMSWNDFGNTAWHLAAERGQVAILKKLWNWAKELQLKREEIRNGVLLSKNKNGETAWDLAAERGHNEILEKLWNWVKEVELKPEEIRTEALLSKNKNGDTACHLASEKGQVEILGKLVNSAKDLKLKPKGIRNKMLSKNKDGDTAGRLAAEGGQFTILKKRWILAKELQLKPDRKGYEALLSKNHYRARPSVLAAETDQVKILEKLPAKKLQLKLKEIRNKGFVKEQGRRHSLRFGSRKRSI